jgi:hypothetical protein
MKSETAMPASCSRLVGDDVEAPLRRNLLALLRHECHLIGFHVAGDLDHRRSDRGLEVELHLHRAAQDLEIAILDVATVLAEVHRDGVGTAQLRERGRPHRVGLDRAPRLSDRGDVIDIDAERGHEGTASRLWSKAAAARGSDVDPGNPWRFLRSTKWKKAMEGFSTYI